MARRNLRHLSRGELLELLARYQRREKKLLEENRRLREDGEEQLLRTEETDASMRPRPSLCAADASRLEAERRRLKHRRAWWRTLGSTVSILVTVAALAVLLSFLFLPVLQISGESMEPVLEHNDIVVALKTDRLAAGDLCSFSWNNKTLIKRVIAQAGDWVSIDAEGVVSVNGQVLEEPYITEPGLGECDVSFPCQVPENSYWVMGDKRLSSIDSRTSRIGYVNEEQIIGKIVWRVWPLRRFGFIHA